MSRQVKDAASAGMAGDSKDVDGIAVFRKPTTPLP